MTGSNSHKIKPYTTVTTTSTYTNTGTGIGTSSYTYTSNSIGNTTTTTLLPTDSYITVTLYGGGGTTGTVSNMASTVWAGVGGGITTQTASRQEAKVTNFAHLYGAPRQVPKSTSNGLTMPNVIDGDTINGLSRQECFIRLNLQAVIADSDTPIKTLKDLNGRRYIGLDPKYVYKDPADRAYWAAQIGAYSLDPVQYVVAQDVWTEKVKKKVKQTEIKDRNQILVDNSIPGEYE